MLAGYEGETGQGVIHLRGLPGFPAEIKDTVWLPRVATQEPDAVVVTADPRITKRPAEQLAWLEAGLTTFFLKGFASLGFHDQALRLVKWWPDIVGTASAAKKGSGFLVSVNGKIESVKPTKS